MRELNAWKKYICSLKEGLSPWYRLSRASSIIRDCKGFLYILASKLLYQDPLQTFVQIHLPWWPHLLSGLSAAASCDGCMQADCMTVSIPDFSSCVSQVHASSATSPRPWLMARVPASQPRNAGMPAVAFCAFILLLSHTHHSPPSSLWLPFRPLMKPSHLSMLLQELLPYSARRAPNFLKTPVAVASSLSPPSSSACACPSKCVTHCSLCQMTAACMVLTTHV